MASMVLGQTTRPFAIGTSTYLSSCTNNMCAHTWTLLCRLGCPGRGANKDILEKVQRRMVRQVSGLFSETYEGKLTELDLTTLVERRHQSDIHMTFKILKGIEEVPVRKFFTLAATGAQDSQECGPPELAGSPRPPRPESKLFYCSGYLSVEQGTGRVKEDG